MRIIEPQQFQNRNNPRSKKNTKKNLVFLSIFAVPTSIYIYSVFFQKNNISSPNTYQVHGTNVVSAATKPKDELSLHLFSYNEFKNFYDGLALPNLEPIGDSPSITGNKTADARIISISEKRGYRLRSSPTVKLTEVDGLYLQKSAATAWKTLQKSAKKAGLNMSLVSGYRSVEEQRRLFLSRLLATGATVSKVAAGTADDKVDLVLTTSSIPGYSKHHTGYTIDILCSGTAFEDFEKSACHKWLIKDNYKEAKKIGFIPSYPELADDQGPDPEAWEYIWVGSERLYF